MFCMQATVCVLAAKVQICVLCRVFRQRWLSLTVPTVYT